MQYTGWWTYVQPPFCFKLFELLYCMRMYLGLADHSCLEVFSSALFWKCRPGRIDEYTCRIQCWATRAANHFVGEVRKPLRTIRVRICRMRSTNLSQIDYVQDGSVEHLAGLIVKTSLITKSDTRKSEQSEVRMSRNSNQVCFDTGTWITARLYLASKQNGSSLPGTLRIVCVCRCYGFVQLFLLFSSQPLSAFPLSISKGK